MHKHLYVMTLRCHGSTSTPCCSFIPNTACSGSRKKHACTCYNCCCWCSLPRLKITNKVRIKQFRAFVRTPRATRKLPTVPLWTFVAKDVHIYVPPRTTTPHGVTHAPPLAAKKYSKIVILPSCGILIVKYSVDQL